jgi:hypothetical protein
MILGTAVFRLISACPGYPLGYRVPADSNGLFLAVTGRIMGWGIYWFWFFPKISQLDRIRSSPVSTGHFTDSCRMCSQVFCYAFTGSGNLDNSFTFFVIPRNIHITKDDNLKT